MSNAITKNISNANVKTKMCRFMYKGCTDPNCTFAHSERECRATRGMSQAMQGVRFEMPENMPTPTGISFILRLPNDYSDDDDDYEYPSPSISLNQLTNAMMSPHYSMIKTEFLRNEFEKSKKSRGVFMARHSAQQKTGEGECDMDLSE